MSKHDKVKALATCVAVFLALCLLVGWSAVTRGGPTLTRVGVADWEPRDSAGEFVFQERIWILGGWKTDPPELFRDVWSTGDGRAWQRNTEELPFHHTDLPMSTVFKGKMWMIGGTSLTDPSNPASNSVWSSKDGVKWEKVLDSAPWSERTATPIVTLNGRLWIFGGLEWVDGKKTLKNDVWSSYDGKYWVQVTADAPWQPRAFHAAITYQGKMWVMGGGSYTPDFLAYNDVWSSEDGENWTKVGDAEWAGRIWFSAVVYQGSMWVIGGWNKDALNHGGIWHSSDGKRWHRLAVSDTWRARHEHSVVVFKNKVVIAGGHADPLTNEVWELSVSRLWLMFHALSDTIIGALCERGI